MTQQASLIQAIWEQNRGRVIVLSGLFVLVLAALLGRHLYVEPYLQSLSTEQFRLQQFVRQRQVEFINSGIPISTAAQLEKNLQQFSALIPSEKDFSHFIGDLFRWAGEAGLAIDQVSYHPEIDKESSYLSYGLSFSVNGSYGQVKKFIHLLENSSRILMIDQISLTGTHQSQAKKESVTLNIGLTTYFQKDVL